MTYSRNMYIGGALDEGHSRVEVVNPATDEIIGTGAIAGIDDVQRALHDYPIPTMLDRGSSQGSRSTSVGIVIKRISRAIAA